MSLPDDHDDLDNFDEPDIEIMIPCDGCAGDGWCRVVMDGGVVEVPCEECGGEGWI